MMKSLLTLLLILLIGSAVATAEDQQSKQLQLNLGGTNLERITDQSGPASTVAIKSYSFQPSTLTVSPGTTITWKNQDSVPHTVTSDSQGLFDSGTLAPGKSFSFYLPVPGEATVTIAICTPA